MSTSSATTSPDDLGPAWLDTGAPRWQARVVQLLSNAIAVVAGILEAMDENKARRVADALRDRGTDAHLARVGTFQFGVSVKLSDGREATWDSDGTAALEAQVMRNGVLVGYVPAIEGSEYFTEEQIIDAIVRTDYDKPIAYQRATAPPPARPLPRKGGLFRRFLDGFRYR